MIHAVRSLALLAALAAAWQPSKALAEDDDTQFWLFGTIRGEIADDVLLTIDTSYRWREDRIGGEQRHVRVGLEHQIAKGLQVGGGAALFATSQRSELRPHQQMRLTGNGFEYRTRFEQRFFERADRVELRLRQRLQYAFALTDKANMVVSGEWLKILQGRDALRPVGTQEVRGFVAVVFPVAQGVEIGTGYLVIVSPRPDVSDRVSHIPQTTVTYRF